jgi:tetratricopeptide (TPR) repeat protein
MNRPARVDRKRIFLWSCLLLVTLGIAAWGIPRNPLVREYRYAHSTLEQLRKEWNGKMEDPLLLFYIGKHLNDVQRFKDADPFLRNAVGLNPNEVRFRDEWTRALLGSGLITAAFGQLREFVGTHPNSPDAHLLLGKFYVNQGAYQRGVDELNQAVKLNPSLGEGWLFLADANNQLEKYETALPAAQKAASLLPNRSEASLLLAILEARQNHSREAEAAFKQAVERGAKVADTHREYARFLLDQGQNAAQAVEEARQAVDLMPDDSEAQTLLGKALLQKGDAHAALPVLQRAADLSKDQPTAPLLLVQVLRQLGQNAEADRWTRIAEERRDYVTAERNLLDRLNANPHDREAHHQLAHLYAQHGDVSGAVKQYSVALHAAPDSAKTMIAAADDLVSAGFAREATPLALRATFVGPHNPEARRAYGNVLLHLGRLDEALDQFNHAARLSPTLVPEMQRQVNTYMANAAQNASPAEKAYQHARQLEARSFGPKRLTPEIQDLIRQSVSLEPNNPRYLGYLLRMLIALRKNDEAQQIAERLLSVAPNNAQAHVTLAFLLLDKASRPEEFSTIQKHIDAASADSEYEPTRRYAQGLFYLKQHDGVRAAKELRRVTELDPDADVTYYKLAQAERIAGNLAAANEASAEYDRRMQFKQQEFDLLGNLAAHPRDLSGYGKAIRFYRQHEMPDQSKAIEADAIRHFGAESVKNLLSGQAPSSKGYPR